MTDLKGSLERRIRSAESAVLDRYGLTVDESHVRLGRTSDTVRMLTTGSGPPVLFLHGATLCAAAWAPLIAEFKGFRVHLIELPGHGLSGPTDYRVGELRDHSLQLMDAVCAALGDDSLAMVGNSLGAMFALWYAARRPERVSSLAAIGVPAVALRGTVVRMPLSMLSMRLVGRATLAAPTPRLGYRIMLRRGLSPHAERSMPDELVDVLRYCARRNAATLAGLNHAMNRLQRPRIENVMDDTELEAISCRPLFIWGVDDPYLSARNALHQIGKISGATLHEVRGGHAPWFEEPRRCAALITSYLVSADPPSVRDHARQPD